MSLKLGGAAGGKSGSGADGAGMLNPAGKEPDAELELPPEIVDFELPMRTFLSFGLR
jgi:hypothetical protein